MKIAYIGQKTPYPVKDGGCFAAMQFIRCLPKNVSKHAFFIETVKHPFTESSASELKLFFDEIKVKKIDTRIKLFHAFLNLCRFKNYNLTRFQSSELLKQLSEFVQSQDFDYLIFDGLYAMALLKQLNIATEKCIYRAHNVEFEIWKDLAKKEKNIFKRFYLNSLSKSLQFEERELLSMVKEIWTMTEQNNRYFNERHLPSKLIPVAFDLNENQANYSIKDCFHLGAMDWQPNIETVSRLVKIWKNVQDLPILHLAGKKLNRSDFQMNNVVNHGEIEKTTEFMTSHGILVSPTTSGSGIRIKLLEAMSLGIPCITTKKGAEGISIEKSGILIAEDDSDFVDKIKVLSNSQTLREKIGLQGRKYMEEFHNFAEIERFISQEFGK